MADLKKHILENGSKIKVMNLDDYYLHATGGGYGIANDKCRILDILEEGKIKAKCDKNYSQSPNTKICLCDTTKPELSIDSIALFSSFKIFVCYSPSLVLNRNLQVETPIYCREILFDSEQERKADMYDEVRVDNEISLDHLEFITFPIWTNKSPNKETIKQLNIFKQNIDVISKEYKKIPIKDLYTGKDITTDDVDRQIEIYQKRLL